MFYLAVHYAGEVGRLLPALLGVYLVLGIVTFLAYALDKSAARKDRWRTHESTLHLLAILGGWPGALVAQSVLRHKTRKQPFKAVFWITVLVNCSVLIWMLTQDGGTFVATYVSPFLDWLVNDFLERLEPLITWLKYEIFRGH